MPDSFDIREERYPLKDSVAKQEGEAIQGEGRNRIRIKEEKIELTRKQADHDRGEKIRDVLNYGAQLSIILAIFALIVTGMTFLLHKIGPGYTYWLDPLQVNYIASFFGNGAAFALIIAMIKKYL